MVKNQKSKSQAGKPEERKIKIMVFVQPKEGTNDQNTTNAPPSGQPSNDHQRSIPTTSNNSVASNAADPAAFRCQPPPPVEQPDRDGPEGLIGCLKPSTTASGMYVYDNETFEKRCQSSRGCHPQQQEAGSSSPASGRRTTNRCEFQKECTIIQYPSPNVCCSEHKRRVPYEKYADVSDAGSPCDPKPTEKTSQTPSRSRRTQPNRQHTEKQAAGKEHLSREPKKRTENKKKPEVIATATVTASEIRNGLPVRISGSKSVEIIFIKPGILSKERTSMDKKLPGKSKAEQQDVHQFDRQVREVIDDQIVDVSHTYHLKSKENINSSSQNVDVLDAFIDQIVPINDYNALHARDVEKMRSDDEAKMAEENEPNKDKPKRPSERTSQANDDKNAPKTGTTGTNESKRPSERNSYTNKDIASAVVKNEPTNGTTEKPKQPSVVRNESMRDTAKDNQKRSSGKTSTLSKDQNKSIDPTDNLIDDQIVDISQSYRSKSKENINPPPGNVEILDALTDQIIPISEYKLLYSADGLEIDVEVDDEGKPYEPKKGLAERLVELSKPQNIPKREQRSKPKSTSNMSVIASIQDNLSKHSDGELKALIGSESESTKKAHRTPRAPKSSADSGEKKGKRKTVKKYNPDCVCACHGAVPVKKNETQPARTPEHKQLPPKYVDGSMNTEPVIDKKLIERKSSARTTIDVILDIPNDTLVTVPIESQEIIDDDEDLSDDKKVDAPTKPKGSFKDCLMSKCCKKKSQPDTSNPVNLEKCDIMHKDSTMRNEQIGESKCTPAWAVRCSRSRDLERMRAEQIGQSNSRTSRTSPRASNTDVDHSKCMPAWAVCRSRSDDVPMPQSASEPKARPAKKTASCCSCRRNMDDFIAECQGVCLGSNESVIRRELIGSSTADNLDRIQSPSNYTEESLMDPDKASKSFYESSFLHSAETCKAHAKYGRYDSANCNCQTPSQSCTSMRSVNTIKVFDPQERKTSQELMGQRTDNACMMEFYVSDGKHPTIESLVTQIATAVEVVADVIRCAELQMADGIERHCLVSEPQSFETADCMPTCTAAEVEDPICCSMVSYESASECCRPVCGVPSQTSGGRRKRKGKKGVTTKETPTPLFMKCAYKDRLRNCHIASKKKRVPKVLKGKRRRQRKDKPLAPCSKCEPIPEPKPTLCFACPPCRHSKYTQTPSDHEELAKVHHLAMIRSTLYTAADLTTMLKQAFRSVDRAIVYEPMERHGCLVFADKKRQYFLFDSCAVDDVKRIRRMSVDKAQNELTTYVDMAPLVERILGLLKRPEYKTAVQLDVRFAQRQLEKKLLGVDKFLSRLLSQFRGLSPAEV